MSEQIINLTTAPNQTMTITINVDGRNKDLQLDLSFNEQAQYWVMTVTDLATGSVLLASIPLITGAFPSGNVLAPYAYLEIGSTYIVKVGTSALDFPDDETLGSEFILVWSDTPGYLTSLALATAIATASSGVVTGSFILDSGGPA